MSELFERIDDSKDKYDTYIELSMLEIYNECIRDLLSDDFPVCPTGGLKLLENEKERVRVDKVTLKRPKSVEEVMKLVMLGNQRRSTSSTESNSVSSRSHSVLQINVGRNSRGHDVNFDQELVRQCISSATLSIIDLAGSERAAATANMGQRMKEGANINKSLLALSSCINALCSRPIRGMKPHVPYRNSKLTRMLKFSLGGNCRTVMIVCVSPSSKDIEETHNTLVWADKAKNVSTKISRNTAGVNVSVAQYLTTISQQDQQIKILEAKLMLGPSQLSEYQKKKVEQARLDATQALEAVRGQSDGLLPPIQEGAAMRALWDGAELRIAALKRRIEAIDELLEDRPAEDAERERHYIQTLIQYQDNAYRHNSAAQAVMQREAAKAETAEKLFKGTEERNFGDSLEAPELAVVRLNVSLQRDALAKGIAMAREKAYRQVIQQQAEDSANTATLFHRLATSLLAEADALSDLAQSSTIERDLQASIEKLRRLASSSESALGSMFDIPSSSSFPIPALPQPSQGLFKLGNPSGRQSTGFTNPPSGFRTASAVRRVMASGKPPNSPRRLVRVAASPRKQPLRPILVSTRNPGHTRKPVQWRDEAGKGDIDDSAIAPAARTFTASSSSSGFSPELNGSSDASSEWDDEPAQPVKRNIRQPSLTPLATTESVISISASTSSKGLPIPAWKKNRMLMGKTGGGLGTLGEETAEQSSPEPGSSQRMFGAMGPPARQDRGPLLDRQQLPPSISCVFPPSTSSTLFKPTAASAARAVNIFATATSSTSQSNSPSRRTSSVGRAPSSGTKAARRASTVGPYRKGRNSMLPQPTGSASLMNSSFASASIRTPIFPLTGDPRRDMHGESPSGLPAGPSGRAFNPGHQLRAPAGGGIPTLLSRPSISRLSTLGTGLDASSRAVWR